MDAAKVYGALLAGELPEDRRRLYEARIAKAYEALQPKWSIDVLQDGVERAFTEGVERIAGGLSSEVATETICRMLGMVITANPDAPLECQGKNIDAAAVRECLRLWGKRGGPTGGNKYEALHAVYVSLGLGQISAEGIRKRLQRR